VDGFATLAKSVESSIHVRVAQSQVDMPDQKISQVGFLSRFVGSFSTVIGLDNPSDSFSFSFSQIRSQKAFCE
jgi:hypothetical protein